MRVGSLFSGIGGLDLAVDLLLPDSQVAWQVEIDPFCRSLLKARFSGTAIHEDVRTVGRHNLDPIDILVGGFPCQDISCAGQGKGIKEDTRSGLFFEMWRIALEMEPRFVLLENVPVITSRGLDTVADMITESGWTLEWHCLAASDVGAHHRRNRWWGIAHREALLHADYWRIGQRRNGWRVLQGDLFGEPEPVGRFPSAGMASRDGLFIRESYPPARSSYPTPTASDWKGPNRSGSGSCSSRGLATVVDMWPTPRAMMVTSEDPAKFLARKMDGKVSMPGLPTAVNMAAGQKGMLNPDWVEVLMGYAHGWTDLEQDPQLGLIDSLDWVDGTWEHGLPRLTTRREHRNKRLRALGNSVVPQCAAVAFSAVADRINQQKQRGEACNG